MSKLEQKTILLSKTEYDTDGGETVHVVISNDWAKETDGTPIFGREYSYLMRGFQLHGPIPKEVRGGFKSLQEAEEAARREYQEWRSGKVPVEVKVTRQEYWEMHYRMNRHLRHLSDQELATRLDEVMNNLMTLTEDQKIGIIRMDEEGDKLSAAFAHVLEEYRLRGRCTSIGGERHLVSGMFCNSTYC